MMRRRLHIIAHIRLSDIVKKLPFSHFLFLSAQKLSTFLDAVSYTHIRAQMGPGTHFLSPPSVGLEFWGWASCAENRRLGGKQHVEMAMIYCPFFSLMTGLEMVSFGFGEDFDG